MLFQKYRPKTFNEFVGQPDALAQVRRILSSGWGGRSWWISGPSGTGKTSLAYLIAREGAEDWFVEEIDASDLTPQRLKEIEQTMHLTAMGKGGRVWIVNEAHGLRRSDSIRLLLTMLERLPSHTQFIFTTTDHGEQLLIEDIADADPLLSRCHRIKLAANLPAFARVARRIAQAEGRDGHPESVYLALARETGGNLRAMLQSVEAGRFPTASQDKPPTIKRSGDCLCGCGQAVKKGHKFASTDHYFAHLRANKRKR
jgi:DNA polymerase-3 subunit gamma/tau